MSLSERYQPIVVRDRDDLGSNPTDSTPLVEIVETRLRRRDFFKGFAGVAALTAGTSLRGSLAWAEEKKPVSTLTFEEVEHGIDETHHVAKGYRADILIRWGDPLVADAPAFDPANLSAAAQEKQFGYNNDFVAFMPLPQGSQSADRGLLCVNHEYTDAQLMWPGIADESEGAKKLSAEQVAVEMAAHGHSVVEIAKQDGAWRVVTDSPYNRRITAKTPMRIAGPAAGHDQLKTSTDASGTQVLGTINNCAGGWTPWGTVLVCEENFNNYFGASDEAKLPAADSPEGKLFKRYGIGAKAVYAWSRHVDRFDLAKEPNEINRFGWVVEYDPYDPKSVPVKRTALGRVKHEGATTVLNKDGRVVVYTGDDERFDYIYRFVTDGKYDSNNREANRDLLDSGTLSVARFAHDGTVEWLPLVHGQGELTEANGFGSQADILIQTRRAADLVGATPMDRPEDIEADTVNGRVYAILTNNTRRTAQQVDAANPRLNNTAGHVIEMIPPGEGKDADHAADSFKWELFLAAGDPVWGGTYYGKGLSDNGWFACPDNCVFDTKGRIWISSDQGGAQRDFGIGDGIWAADVTGDGRATTRFFFRTPRDAEMCGPCFTPDSRTMFLAVQHPGEGSGSTFETPSTRWPDFADNMPPRPSIVVITKEDGGEIGA